MRIQKTAALLTACVLLLSCFFSACGAKEQPTDEPSAPETEDVVKDTEATAEETVKAETPATEEKTALKNCELIYAKGYWLLGKRPYEGNSDEAQSFVSTQRFSRDDLPVGSVISVADGYTCTVTKWTIYPDLGSSEEIAGGKSISVDDSFWPGADYCAFHFTPSAGGAVTEPYASVFTVSVPEETKERREFDWDKDGVLSILTVGNSFSDDAMEYVYDIAKAAGVKNVVLGNLYYGSCRILWHYNYMQSNEPVYEFRLNMTGNWVTVPNSRFSDMFGTYDWDYISFQQCAQDLQSNESLYVHLGDLIAYAKEQCPDAKIVYHMPWANKHANYGNSVEGMYRDCMTTLRLIIEQYPEIEACLTTGTAIQNARTSYIPADAFLRDGWHLSFGLGRYIAGLAFFTQLTGISVDGLDFAPGGLSEDYKLIAIEAAENSRENPRTVTPSQYR